MQILAAGLMVTEVPPRVAQMCAFTASVVHAWIESYAVLLKLFGRIWRLCGLECLGF